MKKPETVFSQFSRLSFRAGLRTKILLAMIFVALLVAVAMAAANYHLRRKDLLRDFQMFVRKTSGTAALSISVEDIMQIEWNADAAKPEFQRAKNVLKRTQAINGLKEDEIYILRPIHSEKGETEFVVMAHDKPFIGNTYIIPEVNRAAFRKALQTGQPQHTEIYTDSHGTWISGYGPILGRQGQGVAVLEVDAEIGRFFRKQRAELISSLGVGLGALALAMLPGLMFASTLTKGINLLATNVKRFQAGTTLARVLIETGDEVEKLGHAFNEMTVVVQEKLTLISFVSRFTADAARRSRHDPALLNGGEHEVVILFADIRGFTRFSENRDAMEVVNGLNQILSAETEVVLSRGGDVDKFIGDAIMAVFMQHGAGVNSAVLCGKELLRRIHEETVNTGWDIALGVGIHSGRAILGAMGSSVRRDFTAIGHTVNLASRLCGKAGRWQLIVSGHVFNLMGKELKVDFEPADPLLLKNIKHPVKVYTYTLPIFSNGRNSGDHHPRP
ncbi:MAG: HAMP domain-containing protein [Verrucomicrobia bacterium]|nr:HAMP domain-containing protein [Verrucomicrobiota bacterium]